MASPAAMRESQPVAAGADPRPAVPGVDLTEVRESQPVAAGADLKAVHIPAVAPAEARGRDGVAGRSSPPTHAGRPRPAVSPGPGTAASR